MQVEKDDTPFLVLVLLILIVRVVFPAIYDHEQEQEHEGEWRASCGFSDVTVYRLREWLSCTH